MASHDLPACRRCRCRGAARGRDHSPRAHRTCPFTDRSVYAGDYSQQLLLITPILTRQMAPDDYYVLQTTALPSHAQLLCLVQSRSEKTTDPILRPFVSAVVFICAGVWVNFICYSNAAFYLDNKLKLSLRFLLPLAIRRHPGEEIQNLKLQSALPHLSLKP